MKILFFGTLLLGLASSVYPETCPPREDVHPCRCMARTWSSDIDVSCRGETINLEDVQKVFKSLYRKENVGLELKDVNLGKAPLDLYKGIGIRSILISRCKLEKPEAEDMSPFTGLEDTLEKLTVYSTITEKNVPERIYLGHLRRFKRLEVFMNTIPEIDNDWFSGESTSLEYIDLSFNKIQKLGDKAFGKLVNLQQINLNNNRLNQIQRSMFPSSAQALTTLHISRNELTDLPEDIFNNMPSLDTISFEGNKITRLDQKTWENIWEQLDGIYLNDNPLRCDSHMHWLFDHHVPGNILGICAYPPEKKGIHLEDFILAGK